MEPVLEVKRPIMRNEFAAGWVAFAVKEIELVLRPVVA